ncbi:MAG TPA: hypothetical protein DEO46_04655 [Lachnospiraceae bacterium]|nr:hypothetical protein [Lachnospiraceae bacterium]
MFNNNLKKEALKIHEKTLAEYNASYGIMGKSCELLYEIRGKSVELIKLVQEVVNSIANTPKQFDTELGKIGKELTKFKETEQYAKEAYDASLKAGVNIVGGTTAGIGIASMAPTALMSIATTFGTASTGTAISALSGAAAQKAAMAWIGRTFAGFAVKEGAGMAAGQAFLALAGPIGWGITAASTGISLISLTNKNKDVAEKAVKEAKEIAKARVALDETTEKINALKAKTDRLFDDMNREKSKIMSFMNLDYLSLREEDKLFLGTLVNHTLSLSQLLNETIE